MTATRDNELRIAKGLWEEARRDVQRSRARLDGAIRLALDAGSSQAEVARVLDWPRQRVQAVASR